MIKYMEKEMDQIWWEKSVPRAGKPIREMGKVNETKSEVKMRKCVGKCAKCAKREMRARSLDSGLTGKGQEGMGNVLEMERTYILSKCEVVRESASLK